MASSGQPPAAAAAASDAAAPAEVPWPASVTERVKKHLAARSAELSDPLGLWRIMGESARKGIAAWSVPRDADGRSPVMCETWLCIVDVLMGELGLCRVPRGEWPVQLQLLGLLANAREEDSDFLFAAAAQLGGARVPPGLARDALPALAALTGLRATLVAARTGKLRTVEELHERIDASAAGLARCGAAAAGGAPSRKRRRRQEGAGCGEPRPAEGAGAADDVAAAQRAWRAEAAMRDFAWTLTQQAFAAPVEEATQSRGPVQGTPLPPLPAVQEAAVAAEAGFPVCWLDDAIAEASAAAAGDAAAGAAGAAPAGGAAACGKA